MIPPGTISIIMSAVKVVADIVKEYPAIKKTVLEILDKGEPTAADWDALRHRISSKSYEDLVPHTRLPKEGQRRD